MTVTPLFRRRATRVALLACTAMLTACGGGSGVSSTPAPAPTPTPTPTPTPAPAPAPTPAPTATNYNSAEYQRSDGPSLHGAITAYQAGASGAGITVGIIDSGIATRNTEFTGRISALSQDFAGNGTIEDEGGHGTAVATVLAAARNDKVILGMAWGSTILALRTDTPGSCATQNEADGNSGCSHTTTAIAQALDYGRTNGARVINISLGGGGTTASLLAAVDRATSAGVIIVISAGNDSAAAPDGFAAQMADPAVGHGLVIIAASVDADGTHSSFSNGAQGYEQSTLSALGDRVLSQDQTGALFLYTGTSFSAPQITGAVALLAQAFPNLTSAQIVQLLLTSASDAGATGPDALFGQGILNVARAFAPAGSTSLAGSTTPVSLTSNGSLSAPMGDAAAQGATAAVVLDRYGRAYSVNLKQTIASNTPGLTLAPALQIRQQAVNATTGPISIAMNIAPGQGNTAEIQRLMLTPQDARQARMLSGSITTRLGQGTTVALGFSQGAGGLSARMAGGVDSPFLIAAGTSDALGFDRIAGNGLAVRQAIGARLALTATAENGRAVQRGRDPFDARGADWQGHAYARFGLSLERRAGPLTFDTGVTHLREDGTVLGARFAPAIGALTGRSLFMDMRARLDAGQSWQLGAAFRQGWTWAGPARLVTNSWALDAERRGVLNRADRLAFRVSQPLRVESGGIALRLPTAYDYATRSPTWTVETLGLAPTGRQIDSEAVYTRRLGAGWLTTNLYWRRQSGNLAWFPDDFGGAARFSLTF